MSDMDKLKMEVEAARFEVMQADKEISTIRQALRSLTTSTNASAAASADEASDAGEKVQDMNSLKLSAMKASGLPPGAQPTINIQLSSPIESKTITRLSDPIDPSKEGSIADFQGVETNTATLTIQVSDADIPLGSSAVYDVAPLCEIDVLGGVTKRVSNLEVAIVPDDESRLAAEGQDEKKDVDVGADVDASRQNKKEKEGEINTDAVDAEEVIEVDTEGTETEDDFQDAKSEDEEVPVQDIKENDDKAKVDSEEATAVDDGDDDDKDVSDEKADKKKDEVATGEDEVATGEDEVATGEDEVVTGEDDILEETTQGESEEANPIKETSKDEVTEESTDPVASESDAEVQTEHLNKGDKENNEPSDTVPETPKEAAAETESKSEPAESASVLVPTCVISFRVEYNPSSKNQKDSLYDLLNKASKRKAMAVDKLRRSAAALNRSAAAAESSSTGGPKKDGVKAGFLNRKSNVPKKDPNFLVRWYGKILGPNSLARSVFPIAKNYILFFGGVALMHFQGQQLALPPPV